MNLKQFIIENPTATYDDAVVYVHIEDKKRVGSGTARGFFAGNGVWKKLKDAANDPLSPFYSLADAVIITASDASSYFGLDASTAEGKANIAGAEALVMGAIMTEDQKNEFLDKALRKTPVFENLESSEFDLVTAEVNLTGEVESHVTLYNGEKLGEIVKLKTDELNIDVVYDFPVTVNSTAKLFAESYDATTMSWLRETRPLATLSFKAGEQNKNHRSKVGYGNRKVRFVAISSVNLSLSVRVTVV